MDIVNAIAKARFASSGPQCVSLLKGDLSQVELLCMEPGQELTVTTGRWVYYLVKGMARLCSGGQEHEVAAGQVAAMSPNERHSIANTGEQRLICFAVGHEA